MQLHTKRYWLLQIAGWGFVGLVMLFFARTYQVDISTQKLLGRITIVFISGILVTHLLRELIRWQGWMMRPLEKVIPLLIVSMFVASMTFSFIVLKGIELFKLNTPSGKNISFWAKLAGSTIDNGWFILPWVLIYYFYHFLQKSRRQQLDALKMESLIKELELRTIKAHINPHFIFNSLNSIRALVDENPQRARRAITELSNILRSSMHTEKLETVPLTNELDIVKDYLALENMRFEDRLKVEYEIDEDTLNMPVPPMMLQTLVENAIKHGISQQMNGGVVKVISDFTGDYHELVVQNTGQISGNGNGNGFGLSSTANRLNLLYGEKAKFEIQQVNGSMVEARVLIPVNV
ncbi:MAG: histidine kinase [Chitinophagaceae bacterium]|nr:histidine kinase [Chitinophagaceae bacterium]